MTSRNSINRLPFKLTFLLQSLVLLFFASCSRIDHKQSALDPKGLVAQNQYDIFMLSVWITIFLFCAVGGCLLYVLWKYRAKSKDEAMEMDPAMMGEEDMSMMPGMMETDDIDDKDEIADPNIEELMKGDPDEIIDVDETMLVQELRRAKRIMNENRTRRQVQLAERSRINSIIDEEVENMMHKYNLGSSWVYGDNRPTASKPGRITRSVPGIGFGKKF